MCRMCRFTSLALLMIWVPAFAGTTGYPGIGRTLYVAIVSRDYPLIQGQLLIMTLCMLTANLVVDLAYVFLDPRLRKA